MELTETLTDDREEAAVDGLPMLPMLPTLPPAPVLPPMSPADVTFAPTAGTADVTVSLPAAWISPSSPSRASLAANAPYGAMPGKPRAGQPSPATLQAAEQRRKVKKRRRIRRIAVLVIAIAVVALAGPPAASWIADSLDKAGSLETETPTTGDDGD